MASLVVTVMGLIAGAAPALASDDTLLCVEALTEEGKCPGEYHPGGTELLATSSKVTFKAPLSEITCEAEIVAETEDEAGEPVLAVDVAQLSFNSCAIVGGGSCTVNVLTSGEAAGVLADEASPGDGDLFLYGSPSPTVSMSSCGFLSGCTYYASDSDERIGEGKVPLLALEFQGGAKATLSASGAPFAGIGFCGTATLTGAFTLQKPGGLWMLVTDWVKLCEEVKINPCEHWYVPGTAMAAGLLKETTATFKYEFEGAPRMIVCATGSLTAKVGRPVAFERAGTLESMSFICEKECAGAALNAPFDIRFGPVGNLGDGYMRLYNGVQLVPGEAKGPAFSVGCTGEHSCGYRGGVVDGEVIGGRDPLWIVSGTKLEEKMAASDKGCGASLTITATFQFSEPTSLGVPLMWVSKS